MALAITEQLHYNIQLRQTRIIRQGQATVAILNNIMKHVKELFQEAFGFQKFNLK